MNDLPLEHRTLAEIAEQIRLRELSSVHVTESLLERIGGLDSTVNAFISLQADEALSAAQRADDALTRGDRCGMLHGVPLAHKDAFQRKDKVATAGACVFDQVADSTATVIRRLEDAATVNLGTLNLDEFAAGGTGENRHHGRCCNPWAPKHVTGGSSSGSAAAVAARFVYAALGGDAGGSIRIPAALCGVVGLKPTFGRVSRFGALPRTWSMDCIGPLARTAQDCALVMEVIAGPDSEDPTTAQVEVPAYREGLRTDLKGLAIGVASGPEFDDLDAEIAGLLDVALGVLKSLGARIVPTPVPDVALLNDLQQVLVKCEAATLLGPLMRTRGDQISLPALSVIQEGLLIPATRYLEAKSMRGPLLRSHVEAVFGKVDALFAPVVPGPAPTISSTLSEDSAAVEQLFTRSARFTRFSNYLGTPGLSVPCGLTASGLPAAFQLLGRPFSEQLLLAVAHAYQSATDHHQRAPALAG